MHKLESVLVGAGAAHHGGDLVQAGGGRGHQDGPELGDPVVTRVDAQGGPVGQYGQRVRRGEGRQKSWVVIACSKKFTLLDGFISTDRGELMISE